MGEGSYDADCWADAREAKLGLRKLLNQTDTSDVEWKDKSGNVTKLGNFGRRRLKAILQFLCKDENKNKDWIAIIKNEIRNRR